MKVTFNLSRNSISIEGDGPELLAVLQAAREIAPKLSEITINAAPEGAVDREGERRGSHRLAPGTMKEWVKAVSPSSIPQKIAAIAAYKARHEDRETFRPKEMAEWFTICGFERPAQMSVALFDAKRKNEFLDKGGHGQWKLSVAGDNFVTRKLAGSGGGE